MNSFSNTNKLIELLNSAYSSEQAAAYAYRGHWKSVRNGDEKHRIREIEKEEWKHRECVGKMIQRLGGRPSVFKEIITLVIGRAIGFLCHVTGWLAPMYFAGNLESKNIGEYEVAARCARDSGNEEFVNDLLDMAEVEWEHERYFRSQVLKHCLGRRIPIWPASPPKESIRTRYDSSCQ